MISTTTCLEPKLHLGLFIIYERCVCGIMPNGFCCYISNAYVLFEGGPSPDNCVTGNNA